MAVVVSRSIRPFIIVASGFTQLVASGFTVTVLVEGAESVAMVVEEVEVEEEVEEVEEGGWVRGPERTRPNLLSKDI